MKYGVIVAEDELLLQKNLIKKIDESPTDFQVVGAAQTGIQALELIEKEVPFLLVTDIRMPVMDGLELIQRAREINPDLDAIIVSGYSEFEYAQTAIHLQVREYLLKPVERKKRAVSRPEAFPNGISKQQGFCQKRKAEAKMLGGDEARKGYGVDR